MAGFGVSVAGMKAHIWAGILVCICICIASAQAQDGPSPPVADVPSVDMVAFCSARRVREMERFFPRRAMERGIEGDVTLDCAFAADNTLHSCQVVEETPSGMGFGAAALAMACRYGVSGSGEAVQTYRREGSDMNRIRWPIRFDIRR